MSSTVSLRHRHVLLDAVRAGQHLQRVDRPLAGALVDRDVRELAVARDELRRRPRATRSMSGFATCFASSTFSARSPHVPSIAVQRSTIVHLGAGELHEVASSSARSAARGSGTPRAT